MGQDRGLEFTQFLAGIDAEAFDERLTRVLVGGQGIGLTARAVQRQHQQSPQVLSQWVYLDDRLQLWHHLLVAAHRELGAQAGFDGQEV